MAGKEKASVQVNPEQLETVALSRFNELARSMRGFTSEGVALEAFRSAKVFCLVAGRVRDDQSVADPVAENNEMEVIEVRLMTQTADEKWVVTKDQFGKEVTEMQPVDRFAYAPNLPDEHPINQRFKPLDGIPPSKRHKREQVRA